MKIRTLVALATIGAATAGMSLGLSPAHAANGVEPITFEVGQGSLALAQTPDSGAVMIEGEAVNMPVTTVTDGRNEFGRTGAWAVTATASDLVESGGASIPSSDIALAQSGTFTTGDGTMDLVAFVSATGDTIDSVYTYTPTATLAAQTLPHSGAYSGTVTQTVV